MLKYRMLESSKDQVFNELCQLCHYVLVAFVGGGSELKDVMVTADRSAGCLAHHISSTVQAPHKLQNRFSLVPLECDWLPLGKHLRPALVMKV